MLAIGLVFCAAGFAVENDPVDDDRGERLYEAHCAICHGIGGAGGRGPRLDVAKLRRAPSRSALAHIIRTDIRGTEMPGSWMLSSQDTESIAGYVESLGQREAEEIPGDPVAGKALYAAQDCAACHIVDGAGSSLGPDLSDVGLRRSAAYLRKELVQPGATSPDGFMMIYAVPTSGVPVEGMRENEDSFSVQIRDADNRFHSFRKSDLKTFRKQRGKSLMPSYGQKLDAAELDDLVAYLASLQGDE